MTVLALGAIEIWAAVPVGIALGLPPPLVLALSVAGAMAGVATIVALGGRVRAWRVVRRGAARDGASEGGRPGRARRIWDRWGVIGLGLLGPLLLGAPISAAVGAALGASPRRLVAWLGLGVLLWCVVLTVAIVIGVMGVETLRG